ncbi:hypothetical protein EJ04DRAFT_587225 [Polyplosphaeria fusca]|uniref:Uncharacterized protein n=1 Tax=Polyplosphaeria fusca TaxID=682080 RepID=A0A9P4QSB9_9PLEO|nr:hypothetical protein EJ04DRAFT_587225 [Polyplosphaeria fusca]
MSLVLLVLLLFAPFPAWSTPALHRHRVAQPEIPTTTTTTPDPNRQDQRKRQVSSVTSVCGYLDGDPQRSRTADPGYECRIDTASGLWGFCSTTVVSAKDCNLVGYCIDTHSCTSGCGRLSNVDGVSTTSCGSTDFCSIALLINGPDQSFEYVACGASFTTDNLFAVPKSVDAATTSPPPSFVLTATPTSLTTLTSSTPIPPSSPSSTDPIAQSASSTPSAKPTTNTPAIVGGVIGALAMICLTILGIFFIRRLKLSSSAAAATDPAHAPPRYDHTQHYSDDVPELLDASTNKYGRWSVSHGPVELTDPRALGSATPVEIGGTEGRGRGRGEGERGAGKDLLIVDARIRRGRAKSFQSALGPALDYQKSIGTALDGSAFTGIAPGYAASVGIAPDGGVDMMLELHGVGVERPP